MQVVTQGGIPVAVPCRVCPGADHALDISHPSVCSHAHVRMIRHPAKHCHTERPVLPATRPATEGERRAAQGNQAYNTLILEML